jgi:hypothetical protein
MFLYRFTVGFVYLLPFHYLKRVVSLSDTTLLYTEYCTEFTPNPETGCQRFSSFSTASSSVDLSTPMLLRL